jgi:transposase, IS5 family
MAKRHPKTKTTGRKSAPVEVILRMLVVKRLYSYSYEATEKRVRDSLSLRQFCRVYLNDVPDDTALIRWANLIEPKTLEAFNQRIVQLAVERKVTKGKKLRTDGTVVESNVRPPKLSRPAPDDLDVLARLSDRVSFTSYPKIKIAPRMTEPMTIPQSKVPIRMEAFLLSSGRNARTSAARMICSA